MQTVDKNPIMPSLPPIDAEKSVNHCSGPSSNPPSGRESPIRFKKASATEKRKTKYDLNEVLHKSILFYEAQRSGKLGF